MSQQAKVTRIDAIKHFRAVLVQYKAALADACELLTHESNRGIHWVDTDRTSYWPGEVRRLDEAIVAAKNALEQCMARAMGDDAPSCADEKKALARLKNKMDNARSKVKETKDWKVKVQREGDDFQTRIVQLGDYNETDVPKAIAALDRIIDALEHYAARSEAPPQAEKATNLRSGASALDKSEGADSA